MAGCGMKSSEAVAVLKGRQTKPYAPFYRLTEVFFATFLLPDLRLIGSYTQVFMTELYISVQFFCKASCNSL
jgi:hypothetical protein